MIAETKAIVLHTRKFGDTSKIATLFTSEYGKISVIAKGSAKPKSKFGSSLDPLSFINITFYKKNSPGLYLLSSAELIKPLRNIHKFPDKLAIGLMILETVSKTMRENQAEYETENIELFELLSNTIINLNHSDLSEFLIFIRFQLYLFKILGFEIDFYNSGNIESGILKFNINNATLKNGSSGNGRIYKIEKNNWKLMESLYLNEDINEIDSENFSFSKIYDFLMVYIGFHLEKPFNLKSKSILMI